MMKRPSLRNPRRLLVMLLLLLTGGALVNVAVAWGCATVMGNPDLRDGNQRAGVNIDGDLYSYWLVIERHRAGSLLLRADWYDKELKEGMAFGFSDEDPEALVRDWSPQLSPFFATSEGTYHEVIARANGWPLLGLGGVLVYEQVGAEREARSQRDFAIPLGDGASTPQPDEWDGNPRTSHWNQRLLPLRPLFPGFAINTVFYAGILWGLFAAPFAFRRRRRVKRGLCPACAYPIADGPACSECGTPVKFKHVEEIA